MTSTRCTTYDWCAETGNHTMHASAYIQAPTPDGYGHDVLLANAMAEKNTPFIGLLDLDLTPAQTRERVAELRRHLDQIEALANRVDGHAPLDPDAETYTVTAPGAGGALLNAELYTVDDPKPGAPTTRLAVYSLPSADADLDVAGADQMLADLERFLPRLRALRDRLATRTAGTGAEARP